MHQVTLGSSDLTMGAELSLHIPSEPLPPDESFTPPGSLEIVRGTNTLVIAWDGCGQTLQRATRLAPADWADLPGAESPYAIGALTAEGTFFRLANWP